MSITELMTDLAACLCAQITVDKSPEPCWCGVMPGQAPILDAMGAKCPSGIAWVRMASAYPSVSVGQAAQVVGHCGSGMGYDLELGILRLNTGGKSVTGPDEALSLAYAEQQIKDMETMRKAVMCCTALGKKDFILGAYSPYGPIENITGGTWTLYVGVD